MNIKNDPPLIIVVTFFLSYIIVNNIYEAPIFLALSIVIMIQYLLRAGGVLKFKITILHNYILLFCIFCYLSSLWAIDSARSIGKGNTILEILVLLSVIILFLQQYENPVDILLKCIMWGGFFVPLYIIGRYGLSNLINIIVIGDRIDNDVLNANSIGMISAYSAIISFYYIQYEGFSRWNIMLLPSILMIFVSGSRKAFIIVFIGIFLFLLLKSINSKNCFNRLIKIWGVIVSIIVVIYVSSKLPIFQSIIRRFLTMIKTLSYATIDSASTYTRIKLINLGIKIFKEHPILGIGIDNATELVAGLFYKDYYYLHNNYIELLADGGIIGFGIYYFIYVILFIKLWKNRDFTSGEFNIVCVLFILRLIIDFGMVSYEGKLTYFFLLIFYLKANEFEKN